jgi:hypothetical protein
MAEEYTGLFGFVFKSFKNAIFPDRNKGKEVFYQGSRQMDSTSRRYYEKELGAVMGPSLGFDEAFGYSEPFRRFVQREGFEPQANEIPNTWSLRPAAHKILRARAPATSCLPLSVTEYFGWLLKTQAALFHCTDLLRSLRPAAHKKPRARAGQRAGHQATSGNERSLFCAGPRPSQLLR